MPASDAKGSASTQFCHAARGGLAVTAAWDQITLRSLLKTRASPTDHAVHALPSCCRRLVPGDLQRTDGGQQAEAWPCDSRRQAHADAATARLGPRHWRRFSPRSMRWCATACASLENETRGVRVAAQRRCPTTSSATAMAAGRIRAQLKALQLPERGHSRAGRKPRHHTRASARHDQRSPHILVTTPSRCNLLLTSEPGAMLARRPQR